MTLLIRLGDTSSHGGNMITSAARSVVEGILVCRITDILQCPIHGPQPIIEGSSMQVVEGHAVARHGDHTACGAALIASAQYSIDNAAVAGGP